MDWRQCVDVLLLLFATASFFASLWWCWWCSKSLSSSSSSSSSLCQRLADSSTSLLLLLPLRFNQLFSNKANGLQWLHTRWPHCVRLWLVWKRLNFASNNTMKPGFLLTFLLAGSTIVHACECLECTLSKNFWFAFSSLFEYISLWLFASRMLISFFDIKISFFSGHNKNGECFADMFVYVPCSWIPFSWISSKIKSNWCTSIKARIWLHKHTRRGTENEMKKKKINISFFI